MQIGFLPLAAVNWVNLIILAFFVISWIASISQKQRQKKNRRRPEGALPNARPQPIGGERPDQRPLQASPEEARLENEIESFLRKVSGQPPAEPPPPPPVPPDPKPRRLVSSEAGRPSLRNESVGEHVQRHISTGGVGQRDAHLAEAIERSDERIENHLHDVFDHRLGKLGTSSQRTQIREGTDAATWEGQGGAPNPLASQLLDMLSSPQQVGAAIVLSEIIRRPKDPWQDDPK